MAADIDVRAISAFSSLSEPIINNLVENPTTELVKSLLQSIEKKAKECEQTKSQKVRVEVELETIVRTSESKIKVLQNSRDKALSDVSKLRENLQKAENARARVESDLEGLRQSTSTEATETSNLKSRIASLETSNRDTLSLLESKSTAFDRLTQELGTQHQRVVELRKQSSALEQKNQEASSAVTSAKFRQTSLEQELELQKKNLDWYEKERQVKNEEHQKFRKDKNARIAELQQSNERYIEQAEALQRSESALKQRLEEQISQNDKLISELQNLREEGVIASESARREIEAARRLAELQESAATAAKNRVRELSNSIDVVRDEAADEIGRIRAEVQQEHEEKENAVQRVSELEDRVSQLEADLDHARIQPGTPQRDVNGGGMSTPQRPGTPLASFTPRSTSKAKNTMSVTQMYSEYTKLERELANERRVNEQLQNHVDSMLQDLEANKPEIDELRSDQARLQSEVFEMSTLTEQANHERDGAVKETRLIQGQLEALRRELADTEQMLRDRNSQVRRLILEQQIGSISDFEYQNLEKELMEANQRDMAHLSGTQQEVNNYLVMFRNIEELQQVNEKQVSTIRNLVDNLENEQAKERQQKYQELEQELNTTKAQVMAYQDEVKNMVVQSQAFVRERDMFRSMLTRRKHLTGTIDPDDFSRSMPLPAGLSPSRDANESLAAGAEIDFAKSLKDVSDQYDSYRRETSTDLATLKKQVKDLTERNAALHAEASRSFGQLTAANQHYETLQGHLNSLRTENSELQKGRYTAMENATKQELKAQASAEELINARGMVESLQRESANLKAEKDLWKNVEKRLVDDNESLRNERSRLDNMNNSLQGLLSERDLSDSETRRRLQNQIESLETELTAAKRKLESEVEENRKTIMRREYDHEQSQKRIDDLVTSLGSTREELASAKTAKDHLQARVDELSIELRSAEERLELLTKPAAETAAEDGTATETTLSREQELTVEVSELRRDLDLKTADLEKANDQIETFKAISQEAEDRLQEFMESSDQYKADTEAAIADKDKKIVDLEQRVKDISSELSTTNSELSKLRDDQGEAARKLDDQKVALEIEIARLKESEERALEQANFNLEASKAQAQIATDAQQNYEAELVKHAEAAKNLQIVRGEANQLKLNLAELRIKAESATSSLDQKESSWSDMESRYRQEVEDLKTRREEIAQQNNLLHSQLESLTQQVTSLKRDRATTAAAEEDSSAETSATQEASNLQEVIKYLRREKEIVEVQYHLSIQEGKRLKQQYDFAQSQLDETRLKLDQQRRADVDLERSAASHNKLMETLNELNLHRESNVTLRAEVKQAQLSLTERTKRIEELEIQLNPLQARVAELENLCELREGEMKLLQQDRDHWQQRTQNILSKYDRVDPAELESLKTQISELELERDAVVAAQTELQAQVDAHPAAIESAKTELKTKLGDQFKERNRQMTGRIKEKQAEADALIAEKETLQSELTSAREELERLRSNSSRTSGAVTTTDPGTDQNTEGPMISATVDQSGRINELETKIGELEAQVSELQSTIAGKDQELASIGSSGDDKFKARETQMKEMLNKRLAEVKKEAEEAKTLALQELRQTLDAQHQREVEELRAQPVATSAEAPSSQNNEVTDGPTSATSFEQFMTDLTEAQAKLLVQQNSTVNNIVKTNIRKHVEREKEALRKELSESQPTASNEEISSQLEELEKKFAEEKAALIKEKDDEYAVERANIVREHEESLEAARNQVLDDQQRKLAEEVEKAKGAAEKMAAGKMNLIQNQARAAQAKVAVVKKAAEETPEKPVKEVWDIAKAAKATDPSKPSQASAIPTPAPASQPPPVSNENVSILSETPETKPETNGAVTASTEASEQADTTPDTTTLPNKPPQSGLPQAVRGNLQGGRGRGTGIPSFRGAARGGRGGAQGRGGTQNSQQNTTNGPAGRGTGSPGRGATLNPAAQQFTPGNKRAREDGEGGSTDGNQGKRIRGGGGGS